MHHPPTHEDFFAPLNHQLEEQAKKKEDEEEIYARSAFMSPRQQLAVGSDEVVRVLSGNETEWQDETTS
ncbi:hypothetical protein COOONC_08626 [Cooperia oncophora]